MLVEAVALLYLAVFRLLAVFLLFSDLYLYDAFGFPPALGVDVHRLPAEFFNFWP